MKRRQFLVGAVVLATGNCGHLKAESQQVTIPNWLLAPEAARQALAPVLVGVLAEQAIQIKEQDIKILTVPRSWATFLLVNYQGKMLSYNLEGLDPVATTSSQAAAKLAQVAATWKQHYDRHGGSDAYIYWQNEMFTGSSVQLRKLHKPLNWTKHPWGAPKTVGICSHNGVCRLEATWPCGQLISVPVTGATTLAQAVQLLQS